MPVNIPFADDFAVLGRAALAYSANPTANRQAVVVLAQRILLLRAAQRRRPDAMARVRSICHDILTDLRQARAYAEAPGAGRVLREQIPLYVKSGLLP